MSSARQRSEDRSQRSEKKKRSLLEMLFGIREPKKDAAKPIRFMPSGHPPYTEHRDPDLLTRER
jgi:hypothetical protein